jgi:hypothetical protein
VLVRVPRPAVTSRPWAPVRRGALDQLLRGAFDFPGVNPQSRVTSLDATTAPAANNDDNIPEAAT